MVTRTSFLQPVRNDFVEQATALTMSLRPSDLVEIWEVTVDTVERAAQSAQSPKQVVDQAVRDILIRHPAMSRGEALSSVELVTRKWATLR